MPVILCYVALRCDVVLCQIRFGINPLWKLLKGPIIPASLTNNVCQMVKSDKSFYAILASLSLAPPNVIGCPFPSMFI